jgi:hypothetical protein
MNIKDLKKRDKECILKTLGEFVKINKNNEKEYGKFLENLFRDDFFNQTSVASILILRGIHSFLEDLKK